MPAAAAGVLASAGPPRPPGWRRYRHQPADRHPPGHRCGHGDRQPGHGQLRQQGGWPSAATARSTCRPAPRSARASCSRSTPPRATPPWSGNFAAGLRVCSLGFQGGKLYGWSNQDALPDFNLTTGAPTVIGAFGFASPTGGHDGMDADPASGLLWAIGDDERRTCTIDALTGTATVRATSLTCDGAACGHSRAWRSPRPCPNPTAGRRPGSGCWAWAGPASAVAAGPRRADRHGTTGRRQWAGGASPRIQRQQAGAAAQALHRLRPRHGVAQGLGQELGRGEGLLRGLPPPAPGANHASAMIAATTGARTAT
jgi:hypothetical protein